ncbi:MAG TPA: hypothetical protein VMU05_03150 [Dongiaceae bacterium]|nr:hypothetical protein [Dongiaceae bacterium]
MTFRRIAGSSAYDVRDSVLHDEIKQRAYELYELQGDDTERKGRRSDLQSELIRVAYAAAQIQMSNRESWDSRNIRAARVCLRALSSYVAQS